MKKIMMVAAYNTIEACSLAYMFCLIIYNF